MSSLHIPPFVGSAGDALGEHGARRITQGLRRDSLSRTQAIAIGTSGRLGATEDGRPVSRQLSRSYFVPRSLEGYERHLRQIQCEGYLQRQSRTTGTWRRRWFLLKDGYLSYFQDQDEAEAYRSEADAQFHHHPSSQRQLSLDCVEAVRTEEEIGPLVIRVISSHRDDLVLRAESKEDMNEWLFGFHRALASVIAKFMENRGHSGNEARDWKAVTHGGGGHDGADGSVDGSQRDPFRATAPPEIRKVLGHGHGRARRLSLRQWRLVNRKMNISTGQSSLALNASFVSGGGSGSHSNGHGTPNSSRGFTPAYGGLAGTRAEGCGSGALKANNNDANPNGNTCGNVGNHVGIPPKPSPHRASRSPSSIEDRRWRAESIGSCGVLGGGSWYGGLVGATEGIGPEPVSFGLARAVSAGFEPSSDDFLDGALDDEFGGDSGDGFELSEEDYGEQENQPHTLLVTATATHEVYGSSGDEDDRDAGRSSESGQGSTSDDGGMDGPGSTLTSQEAFGLGLGMDVEAHSFLQQDTHTPKYIPPHERGKMGLGAASGVSGDGGGKYIPPAMRAAARVAQTAAEAGEAAEGGGGLGKAWPPAGVPPSDDSRQSRGTSDVSQDQQDQEVFTAISVDMSEASYTPMIGGGPSQFTTASSVTVNIVTVNNSSNANADPPCGGGDAGAACAILPNGVKLPWSPARKENYYTGDYHSRRPCYPDGECNARGGGCGGGVIPVGNANTPHCCASALDESGRETGKTVPSEGDRYGRAGFSMDTEGGSSSWEADPDPGGEGLWWSCGAWSIMGRREKQEDRFCVMPDFLKAVDREPPSTASQTSTTSSHPTSETMLSPNDSAFIAGSAGNPSCLFSGGDFSQNLGPSAERGGSSGEQLAQGFFGVYDGHCGSEAVQFVRDRLHTMIGEHASFSEEPDQAIREAFLAADEEFLSLAAERDWFSGTTVLVALLRGRKLLIGNVGDGEAVLCRKEQTVHMSPVHSPGRADESRRILDANGWVTTEQELFLRQLKQMDLNDPQIRNAATEHVRWTTITRVCGELAVSRSIGDRDFKGFTKRKLEHGTEGVAPLEMTVFSWPQGHSGKFRDDLLTAEPEFQSTEIGPDDEFLLMACDGLWDVLGKEEAVEHARKFFDEGLCAQAVAERMCELAYRMGTSDNVTTVVIQFHHTRQPFDL